MLHHDPTQPFGDSEEPASVEAAAAGTRHLARLLKELPASIRHALGGAESNAGQLSDDRLQGLAELIQNADDVGATEAVFAVDTSSGVRILFSHNGSTLRFRDVLGLAVPWLSLKTDDPNSLGRFGIGLMTLRSLSDTLEVHGDPIHLRLGSQELTPLDETVHCPGGADGGRNTVFVIPVRDASVTEAEVQHWLRQWGDSGLVFLSKVETITLVDAAGERLERLHLDRGAPATLDLSRGSATCREVTSEDGRSWSVYARAVATPKGVTRAIKAQATTTGVAIAFPVHHADRGHLHVGLPIRPIGLPFRVAAQFDPLANRRDLADTCWNISLIPAISDLWLDASLHLFTHDPTRAWASVPLMAVLEADERTTGRLREGLESHLMTAARLAFAEAVTFHVDDQLLHLPELACEDPSLTAIPRTQHASLTGRELSRWHLGQPTSAGATS